jgi:hypothetical protein
LARVPSLEGHVAAGTGFGLNPIRRGGCNVRPGSSKSALPPFFVVADSIGSISPEDPVAHQPRIIGSASPRPCGSPSGADLERVILCAPAFASTAIAHRRFPLLTDRSNILWFRLFCKKMLAETGCGIVIHV